LQYILHLVICSYFAAFSFFSGSTHFSYSHPLEYFKSTNFFWRHCLLPCSFGRVVPKLCNILL
jgi:hypothetical protein